MANDGNRNVELLVGSAIMASDTLGMKVRI